MRTKPKRVPVTAKVTVVARTNPKQRGTKAHRYFTKYRSGQTVGSILSKGVPRKDLNYNLAHGFIQLAS